jgi:AraC-like DNA-binding protein
LTTSRRDKGKHLTSEDRHFIEDALNENYTLKLIAERLGKDPTTVSKEVKKNRIASLHKKDNMKVSCSNRKECNQKGLCSASCNWLCKKCTTMNCYKHCPNYDGPYLSRFSQHRRQRILRRLKLQNVSKKNFVNFNYGAR